MKLAELCAFDVVSESMEWPWFAFDASGTRFAYPVSTAEIATQHYDGERPIAGPSFALPTGVFTSELQGFALHRDGAELTLVAQVEGRSVLFVCKGGASPTPVDLAALIGESFTARAVAYDRKGERLWISADSNSATVIVLVDAATHAFIGSSPGRAFPLPAVHELHLHPVDDAILLLASCGPEGTFARVVGFAGNAVEAIETSLDNGAVPAGFVGFSGDATRVHLAEADELRTHAWPGLVELSSIELADEFISNYSGAVFGDNILVDGHVDEGAGDAVMQFDRSALYGKMLAPPVPLGMWAGRIGRDAIVTVDPKAKPARGTVVRIALADVVN